ncbi:hypothetical protein ACMZOO_08670 [Catenovulum sp. SX2]|uniref:hypothetical protein n=1 Tax=Catenovulum sp. SX2 TaxID=3398614 RepID=UPI003F8404F4
MAKRFIWIFLLGGVSGFIIHSALNLRLPKLIIYSKFDFESSDWIVSYCDSKEKITRRLIYVEDACEGALILSNSQLTSEAVYLTPGVNVFVEYELLNEKLESSVFHFD